MLTSDLSLGAILWDMDGTLVDTEPLWISCEEELMRQFDYEWREKDSDFCIGGPMEKVEKYMQEKSGSDHTASWFGDRLVEMMLEKLKTEIVIKPGVQEIIEAAKRESVKIALVSASRRPIVDAVLAAVDIEFDHAISANEVTFSKPHPEGYLRAASVLGKPIETCAIFEDSRTGIMSGLDSGALTLGVTDLDFEHVNYWKVGQLDNFRYDHLVQIHQHWFSRASLTNVNHV